MLPIIFFLFVSCGKLAWIWFFVWSFGKINSIASLYMASKTINSIINLMMNSSLCINCILNLNFFFFFWKTKLTGFKIVFKDMTRIYIIKKSQTECYQAVSSWPLFIIIVHHLNAIMLYCILIWCIVHILHSALFYSFCTLCNCYLPFLL